MTSRYRLSPLLASACVLATACSLPAQSPSAPRNIIIFVADGMRAGSVNATNAPTMLSIRNNGVYFSNSHSLFPTFTTANASAISTGHQLGDTGDFSNTIYSCYPVYNTDNFGNAPGTQTPFLENDEILSDLNDHNHGNYLDETALMALARRNGYNTASVGKLGPIAIQDVTQLTPLNKVIPVPNTVFIDDATGSAAGIPLSSQVRSALTAVGLPTVAPNRSNGCAATAQCNNGFSGNNVTLGTTSPNLVQQQYFVDAMTKAILPAFVQSGKPFYAVYWSGRAIRTERSTTRVTASTSYRLASMAPRPWRRLRTQIITSRRSLHMCRAILRWRTTRTLS